VKRYRLAVVPTPLAAQQHEQARQELRRFSRFLDQQNPEALAASVTQIDATLANCARIDAFFRRYVAALADRRVH
jgi:hypothetical protein